MNDEEKKEILAFTAGLFEKLSVGTFLATALQDGEPVANGLRTAAFMLILAFVLKRRSLK